MGVSNKGSMGRGKSFSHKKKSKKRKKKILTVVRFFIPMIICLFSFKPLVSADHLVFGLNEAPARLIPIKISNPQTFPVSMQIFQGLFDLDEKGEVIPAIVEKWETQDNQKWTFHIRQDIYFHESSIFENKTRKVTGDDVLYSLTRFCSSDSYNAFLLTDSVKGAADFNQGKSQRIEGFSRINDYVITVDLIKPEPFFINRLSTALMCVFPKEMDKEKYADKAGLEIAVGTGPYMLSKRTETEIVLKKNPSYWDKNNTPEIDTIVYRVIRNDQARFLSLQRGHVDMLVLPSSLFSSAFDRDGNLRNYLKKKYQVKTVKTFNTHFIGINNQFIQDENLRKAIFWGTNRKEMVDNILYGFADATGGTVPPGMNGYVSPFEQSLFDPNKAKEYLSRSSYDGEVLELQVHDAHSSEEVTQIFQAQMADIGIVIQLKKLNFGSVLSNMIKGNTQLFSMFFEYVFSSPEPVLINLFSSTKIPVPNFYHFSSREVDTMLSKLYDMESEEASVEFCSAIEKRIMKEAPAVFLYRQKYVVLYPKNLTGLEISGNNHFFLEKLRIKK